MKRMLKFKIEILTSAADHFAFSDFFLICGLLHTESLSPSSSSSSSGSSTSSSSSDVSFGLPKKLVPLFIELSNADILPKDCEPPAAPYDATDVFMIACCYCESMISFPIFTAKISECQHTLRVGVLPAKYSTIICITIVMHYVTGAYT